MKWNLTIAIIVLLSSCLYYPSRPYQLTSSSNNQQPIKPIVIKYSDHLYVKDGYLGTILSTRKNPIIGLFCTIKNEGNDSILFNRESFQLISKKLIYKLRPLLTLKHKYGGLQMLSNQFYIKGGDSIKYSISFESDSKFSKKDYDNLVVMDTVSLVLVQNDSIKLIAKFHANDSRLHARK